MSEENITKNPKKGASFLAMILGAGTIYKLYFLDGTFYVQMREFMGYSNAQIGLALSVAGLISTFSFGASIYIIDRVSKKKLIPFALIGTGVVGMILATFPSYPIYLITTCTLALLADLLFWPTMLKTVRLLGNDSEQGRMFGLLESLRGVVDTVVAFTALAIFSKLGAAENGLRWGIIFYAVVPIVIGIISYFLLQDDEIKIVDNAALLDEKAKRQARKLQAKEGRKYVLRDKNVWLVSLTIFFAYTLNCCDFYFTPFLSDVYYMPAVLVSAYSITVRYGFKILGGPIGGFFADKVAKSATRVLRVAFAIIAILVFIFLFLPHSKMNVYVGTIYTLVIVFFVYIMRAVFFAPISEIKVPREYSGAAMSVASFVGYLPGAFLTVICGHIIDTVPGVAGYKIIFTMMISFCIIGFILTTLVLRVIKKQKAEEEQQLLNS